MDRERVEADAPARSRPRPGGASGEGVGVLALQRSVGNAAVASMIGAQRLPIGDEEELDGGSGGGPEMGTPDAAAGDQAAAPTGGVNELGAVAHVGTLLADSIVAASYSPGAGNIW